MAQYIDDISGGSPVVNFLHRVFAKPVDRLGDVSDQLLAGPQPEDAQSFPSGVDWRFVSDRENSRLDGYVPPDANNNPYPNSGVTIGHGFDLGRRNATDLQRLGLPDDLVTQLTPYLGYRGQAAQDYLNRNPLNISPAQQAQIDRSVFTSEYNNVARDYNAAATTGIRFEDLPQEAQTATMDVAHQYGNLARRTPNFWNQIINGQWQAAHDNLMNFGDDYTSRRHLEAERMRNAINAGTLADAVPRPPRLGR